MPADESDSSTGYTKLTQVCLGMAQARKIVITAICFNASSDIAISGILTWKFAKEELIQ